MNINKKIHKSVASKTNANVKFNRINNKSNKINGKIN